MTTPTPAPTALITQRTVPALTLRATAATSSATLLLLGIHQFHLPTAVALAALAMVATMVKPAFPVAWISLGLVAIPLAVGDGFSLLALGLAPLGHLAVRSEWWAARVHWAGQLELAALVPDLRRTTAIITLTLLVGIVAAWVEATLVGSLALPLGAALLLLALLLAVPTRWWR